MASSTLTLCTISGQEHQLQVQLPLQADELLRLAASQLRLQPGRFKLVLRGATVARGSARVHLADGDQLMVVPERKTPSRRIQEAAADAAGIMPDPDDEPITFTLPEGCYRWEASLAAFLQSRHTPDLLLSWLFFARPYRLLIFAALVAGARVAHALENGPVYILVVMLAGIYINLGNRREGDASAYSVFNPGVQRLPGQLDADVIDQQIRQGHI